MKFSSRSRAIWWTILLVAGSSLAGYKSITHRVTFVAERSLGAAQIPDTRPAPANQSDSVRFAVIGDMGTGDKKQIEVANQMVKSRQSFPFDFVIMVGDNLYGGDSPRDYARKFEQPYKTLLDSGVKFYAALGNHDNTNERFYQPFNMGGQRFYSFKKANVSFFALDSTYMNPEQMRWLENQLRASDSAWKICYFHHPLYSSGKFHGPDLDLRARLEPILVKYGVDVVFTGHEHFYERIRAQKGIYYFIEGSSGKLRAENIGKSSQTIKGFDSDLAFVLVEITGDELKFQTISRVGQVVDSGVVANATTP
jgi:predicted phosphodiesterase